MRMTSSWKRKVLLRPQAVEQVWRGDTFPMNCTLTKNKVDMMMEYLLGSENIMHFFHCHDKAL
jgi:hypothetical protein